MLRQAEPGLERVKAVRHAIGPEESLLVDCHSRFSVQVAEMISRELAAIGVDWFEESVQWDSTVDDLATSVCNVSIPVAGGESGYGAEFFNNLLEVHAVEVVMPDVKYCGGVTEAMCTGLSALRRGRQISLHSPTGPISLLASGHVMAAIKATLPLEYAVHEVEWRAELTEPTERIEHGRLLLPSSAGLGVALNGEAVKRYGYSWNP